MALGLELVTSGRSSPRAGSGTALRLPQNVVDNLNAAAAPIAIEPEAGDDSLEAQHIALMNELIAKGVPRERAMQLAGREVVRRKMDKAISGAEEKLASGYKDPQQTAYNADTLTEGYGFDEAGKPVYQGPVDINKPSRSESRAAGARRYQHRAPYNAEIEAANYGPGSDYVENTEPAAPAGMTVPGPRTLDGKPVRAPQPLMTEDDVLAYDARQGGQLSQRDKDMMARGYVPVVTPDGVAYQPGYVANKNKYAIPGGPGRPGPRTGLEKPYLDGKYEMDVAVGPDGVPRSVYAPTAQFKADQEEVARSRRKAASENRREARKMWQATAMLAGGSHNINSGNRAIYNQAAMLETPEQQAAFLAQFRQTPGHDPNADPRIRVAEIQAKAAADAAAAERESRVSQNQWMAQHQAGVEERAAKARAHDAQMQRQFDAEQRALDREHTASQGDAAREESALVRQAELEQRRQEHAERMAAEERRYQQMRDENASRERAATERHTESMEGIRGQIGVATGKAEAERAKLESDSRRQRELGELQFQQTNPGLYDVITGNDSTEAAINELKSIAARADSFQWLPGGGFGEREAGSMNDELLRLARQAELMGISSPLSDPGYRRELIKRWGYSSGWSGGRGGWTGDWWHPMPQDLR